MTFQEEIADSRMFQQFVTKFAKEKGLTQSEAIAQASTQIEQVGSQYDGLPFSECLRVVEQQTFQSNG